MSKLRPLLAAIISLVSCFLLPSAATAQAAPAGGSVLWLPKAAGRLLPGTDIRGSLSSSDYRLPRDGYFDVWELEGKVGESLTMDLRSDDFDALLYIVGPGLEKTLEDDDGGGGCHARITLTFLENGTFRVIATSADSRTTGVYTLRASTTPAPVEQRECGGADLSALAQLPTEDRQLRVGGQVSGSLSSSDRTLAGGPPVQAWALEGTAGRTVNVTLEADGFDAFLYLLGPGITSPLSDDDSAGELNAQISVTFPETGTYMVVVSSADRGATGAFRLSAKTP